MVYNILIVDDREFDRILYKEYLDDNKYVFTELDDGESVLTELGKKNYDLILLDWQMPRVGGLEVLQNIKNHKELIEVPIIVITGLKDESVLQTVFEFGGLDFIYKPVSKTELKSRVESTLKLSQFTKELKLQKQQLENMNEIISIQKEELEKTLHIKNELAELKEQKLNSEISATKRQLVTFELESTKIYKSLQEIRGELKKFLNEMIQSGELPSYRVKLSKLVKNIEQISHGQDSFSDFKRVFENIDPSFFQKLSQINPKLTSLDLKHCAYIKLNLDNYEISKILNVEPKSIQMTRYRVKKKLKLDERTSLKQFVNSL